MNNIISLDIETDTLNEKTNIIYGIGLYSAKGESFYYKPTQSDMEEIVEKIGDRKLVTHNGVFDLASIYHSFNIDLSMKLEHDTLLMAHSMGKDMELGLDYLANHYLGLSKVQINKLHHKLTEEEMKVYCLRDVEITYKLCKLFLDDPDLPKELYYNEVMNLYREVTVPMKLKGLKVNTKYFKDLIVALNLTTKSIAFDINEEISDKIEKIKEAILDDTYKTSKNSKYGKMAIEMFGKLELPRDYELQLKTHLWLLENPNNPYIFNINSSDQLAWLLFKAYDETPTKISKESKKPSVDKEVLESFKHIPFISTLLKLRQEKKLLSTYAKPILEKSIDGWIYPNFNQAGTSSGRYSSNNPNFQNLPAGDLRIKKGIVAPVGYKIVSADFSSLEPRCFAQTSGCRRLIEAYKKGEEFYSRVAIDVLKISGLSAMPNDENALKKKDPKKRDQTKRFALSIVYGAKAWKISQILGMTEEEAQSLIEIYFKMYPELKEYMNKQENTLIMEGRVVSRFGRVVHLDYNNADKKLRNKYLNLAKNHPIQSLAAHITNCAAIAVARELIKQNIDGQIVSQVHDEIVLYVKNKDAKKAANILQKCMEDNEITRQMEVPIIAEPMIGNNLSEVK